jgi:hypothetical protein
MVRASLLFYACGGLSLLAALIGFLALGDLVQLAVSFPKAFTYRVFKVRIPLVILALGGFAVTLWLGVAEVQAPWWALALYALVFVVLFFGGFIAPIYVMFQPQQHTARFVPLSGVAGQLPDDAEVLTVEINGDARAYPNLWIQRPHVAGDVVGGEEVLMTYCALSHLGVAFGSELEGRKLELKLLTQLENNLILYDAVTQEPIEQISGLTVERGLRLPMLAATMMPFSAFRTLHPEGKVFFNPPDGFLDRKVRGMMNHLLFGKGGQFDTTSPGPVFPTITHMDSRVPPKEQVCGVTLDGKAIAFTHGYLVRNGNVATEKIGDSVITVKHFPEHGFVDVFEGEVPDVDPRGFIPAGDKVPRVPHSSRVLWMIWANYYRHTDVRV